MAFQVVVLILGCFTVCWLPYAIVVFDQVFNSQNSNSPTVYRVMFSLAMGNSGMNPIIYAWKNTSFRKAFKQLLRCKSPDRDRFNSSLKNYLRGQKELSNLEAVREPENGEEVAKVTALWIKLRCKYFVSICRWYFTIVYVFRAKCHNNLVMFSIRFRCCHLAMLYLQD